MAPETQKKERKYVPPSWIDEEFIKTLSPEKQKYWAYRIQGHPGQGPKPKKAEVKPTGKAVTYFDNDGNMVTKNRAARRHKPASDPKYTKATHSLKKKRNKR
tara:strand:+ start:315 stop:620 length:306 start_codon:yes stop_codon:yes gene_type:complete